MTADPTPPALPGAAAAPSRDSTVLRYQLEHWAATTPQQVFAVFEDGSEWTYAQALASVRSTALGLQRLGVQQGDMVAVLAAGAGGAGPDPPSLPEASRPLARGHGCLELLVAAHLHNVAAHSHTQHRGERACGPWLQESGEPQCQQERLAASLRSWTQAAWLRLQACGGERGRRSGCVRGGHACR